MSPLILPIVITLLLIPLRIPLFESVAMVLVVTPVLAFLPGSYIGLSSPLYLAVLLGLIGLLWSIYFRTRHGRPYDLKEEILPITVLIAAYGVVFGSTLQWPDFISIGERIRDYALVAGVIREPIALREPWMAGYPLNYYAYWYRYGHLLSSLFNLEAWEVYHRLQALTFSLFVAGLFQIARRYLGFSILGSLASALIIAFGSNLDGIHLAFTSDSNWWRPSRVIEGAINEFPAWSFLLGDVHPHYLNLPLVPILILALGLVMRGTLALTTRILLTAVLGLLVAPLLLFNSNAWEMPLWLVVFTTPCVAWVTVHGVTGALRVKDQVSFREVSRPLVLGYLGFFGLLTVSLYLSSRNILPGGDPLTLVRDPIRRTEVFEMGRHFGFPLALIFVATSLLLPTLPARLGALAAGTITLISQEALPFLYITLFVSIARVWWEEVSSSGRAEAHLLSRFIPESIGIAGIIILVTPELVFLNDPYGGENERMNTIFKAYTFIWPILHLYAFFLMSRVVGRLPQDILSMLPRPIIQILFVVVFLKFTWFTAGVRASDMRSVEPFERGLSKIDAMYPGAGEALKRFALLPEGVTLEAQGNPYSLTSHVATLGNKTAYLGWANHVNLLTRAYGEVERRERVTREFYGSSDCAQKREILSRERITYAVFGPLERQQYPTARTEDFDCLETLISEGTYRIYR